jgi:hypothetical protein
MKTISIDVGIKNMALCVLEHTSCGTLKILHWSVLDLSGENETPICNANSNLSTPCKNTAKFKKADIHYCLKHAKKHPFIIPTNHTTVGFINKQKVDSLKTIAQSYSIQYDINIKKPELLSKIQSYLKTNCFESINTINASKIDMITLGKHLKNKLDFIFQDDVFDNVIIENQISPIANRMKTIQGMIAQYFIMKNNCQHIEFVSSFNKLKSVVEVDSEDGLTYSERKKTGILRCVDLLTKYNLHTDSAFFIKHKKKDDLADSFLQAIWFINNKINHN